MNDAAETIRRLFEKRGSQEYAGEAVSQLAHALQAAQLAEDEGAPPDLVLAALLHDVGHLFDDDPAGLVEAGEDTAHERKGAAWLSAVFGPAVTTPIRLHVAAKRYLCAVKADYEARLSPASRRSLALQGGAMTPEEAKAWIAQPHAEAAVRLRGWDDAAKIPDAQTRPLSHFLRYLEPQSDAPSPSA